MPLSLAAALAHPTLAAARPVVRAGAGSLDRPVRWVHSSEVFDIAHLLRGGELLLTGGVVLATADPADLRRYVRDLSARRIAGVAIETGPHLPSIPPELIEAAAALDFPVMELPGVVPFVEVAEAINGLLVNDSLQRLRRGDTIANALSAELARGGGAQELVETVARNCPGRFALLDPHGEVIAVHGQTSTMQSDPSTAQSPPSVPSQSDPGSFSVPVNVQGVTVAVLVAAPDATADQQTVAAILDRAPAALAISLLRAFPPSAGARAAQSLLRMLGETDPAPERLTASASAAGLNDDDLHVGVAGRSVDGATPLAAIDAALHRQSTHTISVVADEELRAIVVLGAADPAGDRRDLLDALRHTADGELARVAVGPPVRGLTRLPATLDEAWYSLDLAADLDLADTVVDASSLAIERLGRRIGDPALLASFVREMLGDLLETGPDRARRLITTLDTYLQCGSSKTEAAAALHVQRQTLYQRLEQIFALLGQDPTGTPRIAAVHLATRLYLSGLADPTRR